MVFMLCYSRRRLSPKVQTTCSRFDRADFKLAGATALPDKRKIRLKLERGTTGCVTMVRSLDVKNATGEALVNDTIWYTLNQIPK